MISVKEQIMQYHLNCALLLIGKLQFPLTRQSEVYVEKKILL